MTRKTIIRLTGLSLATLMLVGGALSVCAKSPHYVFGSREKNRQSEVPSHDTADKDLAMIKEAKAVEIPAEPVLSLKKGSMAVGDRVWFSNCYALQESYETGTPLALNPSGAYTLSDLRSFDRTTKTRGILLKDAAGQNTLIQENQIAFVSALSGGKNSDWKNGNELTPVSSVPDVSDWKLTLYNPYSESKNPTGLQEVEVSNIRMQGHTVCFDYEKLYSTGNIYLSAILTDQSGQNVLAYDRIVDATERGNGTAVIYWPSHYNDAEYKLKIFTEKYNGDGFTDYISDMRLIKVGVNTDAIDD